MQQEPNDFTLNRGLLKNVQFLYCEITFLDFFLLRHSAIISRTIFVNVNIIHLIFSIYMSHTFVFVCSLSVSDP
jgi:hypothetical protein